MSEITDFRLPAIDRTLALPREGLTQPRELRWTYNWYQVPNTQSYYFVVTPYSPPYAPITAAPVPEPPILMFLMATLIAVCIGQSFLQLWRHI